MKLANSRWTKGSFPALKKFEMFSKIRGSGLKTTNMRPRTSTQIEEKKRSLEFGLSLLRRAFHHEMARETHKLEVIKY